MPLFLDACALAKRYIPEGESTRRMQAIMGRFDRWGGFVVSSLIEPEVISVSQNTLALRPFIKSITFESTRAWSMRSGAP